MGISKNSKKLLLPLGEGWDEGIKPSIYNPHLSPLLEGEGIFRGYLMTLAKIAGFSSHPVLNSRRVHLDKSIMALSKTRTGKPFFIALVNQGIS
jgi:hypothetical protein